MEDYSGLLIILILIIAFILKNRFVKSVDIEKELNTKLKGSGFALIKVEQDKLTEHGFEVDVHVAEYVRHSNTETIMHRIVTVKGNKEHKVSARIAVDWLLGNRVTFTPSLKELKKRDIQN